MSDRPQTISDSRVVGDPLVSIEQRSRWPGWIWAVPVAAIAIVGWLAFKQITDTGPEITVIFPAGGGIGAGTSVQYRGQGVGEVETIAFEDDLQHVRARIRMDAVMTRHLGKGTLFWIEGPTLSNLATIKSVISGPTIGFFPKSGTAQREYVALPEAPLMEGLVPGRSFVLHARDFGNVGRGAAVMFRSLKVGSVQSVRLLPDRTFEAVFFVEAPYDKLVSPDSRFWNAGDVQFGLGPAGPHLQVPSVGALLSGAVAFDSPNSPSAAEAESGHAFALYGSRGEAEFAPSGESVAYRVVLGAEAGAVADGAPVMLAGKQVGTVEHGSLRWDAKADSLRQPLTLAIEPARLGLPAGGGRAEMDRVMAKLIAQGLRAQPGSAVPLIGPSDVELSFIHGAPAATLAGDPPEIPAAPGGGGVQGILAALDTISNKIGNLPVDEIAADIHIATARLAELSESPALAESLETLNRAVNNLEATSASVRSEMPRILGDLRETVRQATSTVAEARRTIETVSGEGTVGLNSASLSQTLYELTRAAQAMRELADYLDRNPSALVRGRQ